MLGRKLFSLLLVSVFLAITTSIGLCHSDGTLGGDPYCPACNFQSSCVAIDIIEFSLVPDSGGAELVSKVDLPGYSAFVTLGFPARPPPVF
jgi:hypothetical protein